MLAPKPGKPYSDGDTSRCSLDSDGFIDFAEKLKHLGSIIVPGLSGSLRIRGLGFCKRRR